MNIIELLSTIDPVVLISKEKGKAAKIQYDINPYAQFIAPNNRLYPSETEILQIFPCIAIYMHLSKSFYNGYLSNKQGSSSNYKQYPQGATDKLF